MSDIVTYLARDPFFEDVWNTDWALFPRARKDMMKIPQMKVDFMEKDNEYVLHAELPGYKKEDLNVHVDNGVLSVEASKNEEKEEKTSNYYHKERSWGKVQRSFRLPVNADKDKAAVAYVDGVLTVSMPKCEVSTKKKLTIQ